MQLPLPLQKSLVQRLAAMVASADRVRPLDLSVAVMTRSPANLYTQSPVDSLGHGKKTLMYTILPLNV